MRRDYRSSAPPRVARAGLRVAARILGVFGVIHILAGCTLESEKPELALDTPAKYRAGNGEAATPRLDWWRGFGSRELTALIDEAQAHNFDIAVAVAQIEQADAQVRIAQAPLFPTIDGNASANVAFGKTGGNSVLNAKSGTSTIYASSLSASYVLDFWGKNQSTLVAAEEDAVASRYNREVVALTTISTVATTYFTILGAEDSLRILHQNVEDSSRILDLIMQQFSAGTASQINVAQQQSLVASLKAQIPPVEQTRQQNLAALAVLVGRAPEHFTARGGSMMNLTIPRVTPGLPSQLLDQRPDLRQAEALLAAANYNVNAARAAFFPNIALTAQTGFQSAALSTLFGPGAWFYTATAALTQPIFDGGLLAGQLDVERSLRQEALQTYRKDVLAAFSDVEKALIAMQQTALQEKYLREDVLASQMAFYLSEQQLREGTVNLVTLLQVEQTLFQAESQLVQAQLAHLLATVSLFQALGGGWSPTAKVADAAPAAAKH
ncbi:MAG TPA: efflux transporter outer membrane subunit [Xanthobacteraceae bacterium]|jgi:NodT family efflux transporter outer membrane factor (OMF) lipoprotein|nr:efflux transporter outer membrane subunit [Xanthobacteraceae bacterium]